VQRKPEGYQNKSSVAVQPSGVPLQEERNATVFSTVGGIWKEPAMTVKPYDPTLKALVETEPEPWPGLLGRPTGPTVVIDADIATVSGAADKVPRVAADPPYLLHLEFVAGHDVATLPRKLHVRNGLLEDHHDLRVRTAVVLLRPEADSPQLTEVYQRSFPGEESYLTFFAIRCCGSGDCSRNPY
jgi:hypothetical protein